MTIEVLNTLYVQTQGTDLRLDQDALRIHLPDAQGHKTLPLRRIDNIVVYGNINLSTPLITRCAQDNRPITWMSGTGRFEARLETPANGNILLRHAQHLAHADPAHRLDLARPMVAGKLRNSRWILLKGARDAKNGPQQSVRDAAENIRDLIETIPAADSLDTLMGIEGNAARLYFTAFRHLQRPQEGIPSLTQRTRRPPTDPTNALLSFTYGLLRTLVHGACEHAGLDPRLGFLHGLRPGKPALALDLMEEFRAPLADRFVLTQLNRRQLRSDHFETLDGGSVNLTEDGRKTVFNAWHEWRTRPWHHPLTGREIPAGLIPALQARILARHLRGELPAYLPWITA
ncbi:type I-C CRISPR-associated endonuclease Cas1c [Streptomyces mayteni]